MIRAEESDLHLSCQTAESQKKGINCHANGKQMRFKSGRVKGVAKKMRAYESFVYWYAELFAVCTIQSLLLLALC